MSGRVVITGIGAISALGDGCDALWNGLLSGRNGVRVVPALVHAGLTVTMGAAVGADTAVDPAAAELALAAHAMDEALGAAGLERCDAALLWANGLDAVSLDPAYQRQSSAALFDRLAAPFAWPRRRIATACASGAHAIAEALRVVRRSGRPCVAGGSSAMLTPFYVHGLSQLAVLAPDRQDGAGCRPFDRRRSGIALGDGAAALVLEPLEHARARGVPVLAELLGAGVSHEAHDFFKPAPDGRGAALAIRRALDHAGIGPDRIDAVIAHATGTVAGDVAEAAALRSILGARVDRVPVSAIKGAIGHTMMAAGAIGAVIAVRALGTGRLPPSAHLDEPDGACPLDHVRGVPRDNSSSIVLDNAFGMGGHDVVLVIARGEV